MTCIDVAQDVVFHLHNETDNKFLRDEKKNKRERGRGANYFCMSHVRVNEKVHFKNKSAKTPE